MTTPVIRITELFSYAQIAIEDGLGCSDEDSPGWSEEELLQGYCLCPKKEAVWIGLNDLMFTQVEVYVNTDLPEDEEVLFTGDMSFISKSFIIGDVVDGGGLIKMNRDRVQVCFLFQRPPRILSSVRHRFAKFAYKCSDSRSRRLRC